MNILVIDKRDGSNVEPFEPSAFDSIVVIEPDGAHAAGNHYVTYLRGRSSAQVNAERARLHASAREMGLEEDLALAEPPSDKFERVWS